MGGRNSRIIRNRESSNNFDFNIKPIAIVIAAIIAIIIIIVLIKNITSKNTFKISANDRNISYEYFALNTENASGVIDKNGNIIIEAKYSEINIPNPSKDVFVCYLEDGKCEVLNKKNEKLFSDYELVDVIGANSENSEVEQNILKYEKENHYGLIDLDGNIVTEAIYDEISSIDYKTGCVLVKKDEKFGLLDIYGNTILGMEYDSIVSDGFYSDKDFDKKTGFIVSQKRAHGVDFGYFDYKGNCILDVKYESIERALKYDTNDIYLIAMQNGKKGVFKNKKKVVDLNYQEIIYSSLSNIFIVNKNGKYGFYNLDGSVILKTEYTSYSVAGNYISVKKEDENLLYDVNGNLVNKASYKKMIETGNPAYFIAEDESGLYSIISKESNINEKFEQVSYAFDNYFTFVDEKGKAGVINALTDIVEIEPEYDFVILIEGTKTLQAIDGTNNFIDIYSSDLEKVITMDDAIVENLNNGYVRIYSENEMKYFDENGKIVKNTQVYPDKKLYATYKDDKWGYATSDEKVVVECIYDIVTEFNEYGFAGVKKDGKWGVIDENGKILVQPSYELDTYYFPKFIGKYLLNESEGKYCEEINGV